MRAFQNYDSTRIFLPEETTEPAPRPDPGDLSGPEPRPEPGTELDLAPGTELDLAQEPDTEPGPVLGPAAEAGPWARGGGPLVEALDGLEPELCAGGGGIEAEDMAG